MKEICPFLKRSHGQEQICSAGVNFRSVGKNREMCRVCPLAELGNVPLCENLEVYTYMERAMRESNGIVEFDWTVLVETECFPSPLIPGQDRCAGCPGPGQRDNVATVEAMMLYAVQPLGEPA